MNEPAKANVVIEPNADIATSPAVSVGRDPGGPIHTHTVTAAGILAILAGVGLMIASPHLGPNATLATSTGIGLIAFGAGGTTFGKSPAIP